MIHKIIKHFKSQDPILHKIAIQVTIEITEKKNTSQFFESLCDIIIGQQLSGKVADVIFARFKKIFTKEIITPEKILELDPDVIRSSGISYAKINSLKDLSHKVINKEITLSQLPQLSDEEVMKELIKVKGIGPWSAEMFLMFTLGREDVFSLGDLGLKNAIKKLYAIDNPTKEQIAKLSEQWKPYRSYAARILWKSLEI